MVLASRHFNDVVSLEGVELLDARRIGRDEFVADAELAVVVHAPGEDVVLVVDVERMVVSAENISSIFGGNLLHLHRVVFLVPRVQHSPELAGISIAPGEHLAASAEGERVVRPTGDLLEAGLGLGIKEVGSDLEGFENLGGGLARDGVLQEKLDSVIKWTPY